MISVEILFALIVGLVLGAIIFLILSKKNHGAGLDAALEARMMHLSQEIIQNSHEQFLTLAQERLSRHQETIQKDVEHKKSSIEALIGEMRKDLLQTKEHFQKSDLERTATFSSLKQELETYKKITGDLQGSADELKKVLSNNQLRGQFGEQIAENLLKMAGFVIGQDYIINTAQDSTNTRPDFTVFLPDKTKINIDVKFPYAALVRAAGTEDQQEKELHYKTFAHDVRQKIKQVTTRDYINPEEKTVDFVILFIPNEMIFSYIFDQCNDIWEEAMAKKVIMSGPYGFTALLRMVKQAYTNFRYQENLQHVIGLIQKFEGEYEKFQGAFSVLGDRLSSATKQYELVSGTRSRAMNRVLDQIRNEQKFDTVDSVDVLPIVGAADVDEDSGR